GILFLQGCRVFRVQVMNLSALGIAIDQHHGAGKTHIRPADVDDFAERLATVVAAANVAALQAARRPITATPHSYVALGSPLLNRNTRLLPALAESLKGFAERGSRLENYFRTTPSSTSRSRCAMVLFSHEKEARHRSS